MTPRRILLTLCGLLVFGTVYAVYVGLLGWLDGLPVLPPQMLAMTDGTFRPPLRVTSPTIERLKEAFGDHSPEMEPAFYPTQLEFRNGETSTVVAAGRPPSNPGSNKVHLSPFSVAVFSKPRPAHLLQPGEVNEISTFHSDKALLVFDRVIHSPTEMSAAKLVHLELISDPEQTLPDPRQGLVHITNNQRSADPNRFLVLKTVGPVFYRDAKGPPGSPPQLGPDIWADAPIELVDRGNLPRRAGSPAATAPSASDDLRNSAAVAGILSGQRLPPPTVTAVGMRVYLVPDDPAKAAPRDGTQKKGTAGFSGLRRIDLLERVVMHLWVEGGQGLVGSDGKSSVLPEASPAIAAAAGGLVAAGYAAREFNRDLLQVETRGPFAYDAETHLARFDVLPHSDPNLLNDVQATKIRPRPGIQMLLSQVLELEFFGSPTGEHAGKAAPPEAAPSATAPGPRFKKLHAWTYTPGRLITISSDVDQMVAYGQDLVRLQTTEWTQLTGSPLYAVQQRSVLTAGSPTTPATLVIEPAPATGPERPAPGATGAGRQTRSSVLGAGRLEIYDAAANANTLAATWQTSMVQTKERVNDRELDLYTFTDGAKFEDLQSDYWLKGNVLKLWLAKAGHTDHAPPAATPPSGPASRSLPDRLQAIGEVSGHSGDLDIEQTEQLNTLFRDVPPPQPASTTAPVAPMAVASGSLPKEPQDPTAPQPQPVPPVGPQPPGNPPPPREPEKPKPPMKVRARTIDTWVVRYPQPKPPGVPAAPGAGANEPTTSALKYQLEKARCEGMVIMHQDPDDPAKPRGTDILGSLVLIDSTVDGSILTVFGWDVRPGEVHNEGTSLIGPKVVVDQLHNLAVIEGRGSLVMPASSDLSGAELKQAEVVVVHFRDGMKFEGTKKIAEFFGKVNASQGESWVVCHVMQVIFDRPVYFSQSNRPGAKPASGSPPNGSPRPAARQPSKGPNGSPSKGPNEADEDKPKIEFVYCYPAPADTADTPQESKQVAYTQVERDPDTGKPIRRQQLVARELTLRAQVREEGRGEPYRQVLADGPGVVRMWGPESRDEDNGAAAPPKKSGTVKPPPAETEMKLTVIHFAGRMTGKDKGEVFKEATFLDTIQVINVPTDNPDLVVERHKLPPKSLLLTCTDKLVVWSHKDVKKPESPTKQFMHAYGNAYLRDEEYDGWGEVIRSEGKVVWLDGTGLIPARIQSRFKGNDNAGRQIRFDRAINHYTVTDSIGGLLTPNSNSNPPPPKSPADDVPRAPRKPGAETPGMPRNPERP